MFFFRSYRVGNGLTRLFFDFSVKEAAVTEVPESNGVSQEGIVALGVVFGIFAISMGTFIGYLIYREKSGRPSCAPQVN